MAAFLEISHQAQYEPDIMFQMFHFQKEKIMTDFKIMVNGKAIHCHRLVLAAACPYFVSLFNSGMKESMSGEVSMDTLNYDSLHRVVEYMYGHDVNVSLKSASDLFEICEILQFESLKKQLCLLLKENINADNCIQFWKMAETYGLSEIASTAKSIMEEEFNMVAKSDAFQNLSLAELLDYIRTANISNRDHMIAGCFDWVNVDKAERQQSLVDIIGHMKLDECSLPVLQEIYTKNKDVVSLEVAHIFVEAFSSVRKDRKLVVLGGMDKWQGTPITTCWVQTESLLSPWEKLLDIPIGYQAMHCPILCLTRGFVVLCGGGDFRKNTMYDANCKSWINLPPTPVGLYNTTAITKGKEIILLGGRSNNEVQNFVYSLDMNEMKWADNPEMLVKQALPIATTVDDDIFVLYNNHNPIEKIPAPMQKYCNTKKEWTFIRSPPEEFNPRGAKLISCNISLYCIGGSERLCARYSINEDAWTLFISHQKQGCFYSAPLMMNNKIYIAGGDRDGKTYLDIEEYDIEKDSWKVCSTKLMEPLAMFAMGMVDWL